MTTKTDYTPKDFDIGIGGGGRAVSPAQRTSDVLDRQRWREDFEAKATDKLRHPHIQRF